MNGKKLGAGLALVGMGFLLAGHGFMALTRGVQANRNDKPLKSAEKY